MIHETVIDESLNLLLAHFKHRVHVRPPASAQDLATLEALVGPLPRDLTILLATCNGIRVDLADRSFDEHLCCIREIQQSMRDTETPASSLGLLRLRGDPATGADWLVLDRGPARDCVVRWNPSTTGAVLIASSFGHYFQSWTTYLMHRFDREGRPRVDRDIPPFDASFIIRHDHELARLRSREDAKAWLHSLDLCVPSGDDFE